MREYSKGYSSVVKVAGIEENVRDTSTSAMLGSAALAGGGALSSPLKSLEESVGLRNIYGIRHNPIGGSSAVYNTFNYTTDGTLPVSASIMPSENLFASEFMSMFPDYGIDDFDTIQHKVPDKVLRDSTLTVDHPTSPRESNYKHTGYGNRGLQEYSRPSISDKNIRTLTPPGDSFNRNTYLQTLGETLKDSPEFIKNNPRRAAGQALGGALGLGAIGAGAYNIAGRKSSEK